MITIEALLRFRQCNLHYIWSLQSGSLLNAIMSNFQILVPEIMLNFFPRQCVVAIGVNAL